METMATRKKTKNKSRRLQSAIRLMRSRRRLSACILMTTALGGCEVQCQNEVLDTLASPRGDYVAVTFARNCGATTGQNTQVSIVPAHADIKDCAGNALAVDGRPSLRLQWRADGQLVISGAGNARAFKKQGEASGVAITYE